MEFYGWLMEQTDRDDDIGRMARDARIVRLVAIIVMHRGLSAEDWRLFFAAYPADTLHRAVYEWEEDV